MAKKDHLSPRHAFILVLFIVGMVVATYMFTRYMLTGSFAGYRYPSGRYGWGSGYGAGGGDNSYKGDQQDRREQRELDEWREKYCHGFNPSSGCL